MPTDKIILGIDPGTNIMGYGVIQILDKKMKMIQMGVIHLEKLDGHGKRDYVLSTGSSLLLRFKSDDATSQSGFQIQYEIAGFINTINIIIVLLIIFRSVHR